MNSEKLFQEGKIRRTIFKLALPLVISQIINVLYNIVDRIYVGNLPDVGKQALAGLGVTFPIIMIVSAFSALFGNGGAPIASILLGEGKKEEARQTMMNSFVMLVAVGLFITALTLVFDAELLHLFGAEEEVMSYAVDYLDYYVAGTVFAMLSVGMTSYITAQGFSNIAMLSVALGAFLNIVLDPLFIFTFGLGVKGAAVASVLSQAASAFFALIFLSGKRPLIRFGFRNFRFRLRTTLSIALLGISPFIMNATESLVQIVFNNQIGKYAGEDYTLYINLITILNSVLTIMVLPLAGLAQGAAPLISYNYGSGRTDRVREAARFLIKTCFLYSFGFYLLIFLLPKLFAIIFNDDPALLEIAPFYFRIFFLGMSIFGIQIACQNIFLALRQSLLSLLLALLRKVVLLVPFALVFPMFFGIAGVYYAEAAADVLAVIATFTTFKIAFGKILENRELELAYKEFGRK